MWYKNMGKSVFRLSQFTRLRDRHTGTENLGPIISTLAKNCYIPTGFK